MLLQSCGGFYQVNFFITYFSYQCDWISDTLIHYVSLEKKKMIVLIVSKGLQFIRVELYDPAAIHQTEYVVKALPEAAERQAERKIRITGGYNLQMLAHNDLLLLAIKRPFRNPRAFKTLIRSGDWHQNLSIRDISDLSHDNLSPSNSFATKTQSKI